LRIFVSIAAYRDPELIPTVLSCLATARYPEQCRFGICWQHGPEERVMPFGGDPRFRVLDVDWRQSHGACWARSEIMRLWEGEEYYLQLDSHHRFVQDWDIRLLHCVEAANSSRPIITAYGAPYTPGILEYLANEPLQINFDRFTEDGIAIFRPGPILGLCGLNLPVRARFLSAHFLFTVGSFVEDVSYDPELYFLGEEITLAVRAFTSGYDFFHPSEVIVWHEYTRNYRRKHWDDHVQGAPFGVAWHIRDAMSRTKIARFLTQPHIGPFGCGTARSFHDYEVYAGLDFQSRQVQASALWGEEPPKPIEPRTPAKSLPSRVQIVLDRAKLPLEALYGCQFWYFGVYDEDNKEIFRRDLSAEDVGVLLTKNWPDISIELDVASDRIPVTWVVWPFSSASGWLDRLQGTVSRGEDRCFVPS
jgi:hypothetical protein